MIKVKMIYMARKHKRNQETYARLGFLPKPKELTNTTIEQNIQLGVTQDLDKKEGKKLIAVD